LNKLEVEWKEIKPFTSIQSMVKNRDLQTSTSIYSILQSENADFITGMIAESIANYVMLLPANRTINANSVIAISKAFTNHPDLKQLRVNELKSFFHMAFIEMKFGKAYGGFGYDTLIDWFNQFNELKFEEVIRYRENEHMEQTTFEKQRREKGEMLGINQVINKKK
jgi:hypothetical protein